MGVASGNWVLGERARSYKDRGVLTTTTYSGVLKERP
jgi:hypothetical protein